MRETGLTTTILQVPTDARNFVLVNDREALRTSGVLFAEGVRNSYDLAFSGDGELFASENGPDRDMSEEINWLRQGHHYGFPWRMGFEDNPQRDPTTIRLRTCCCPPVLPPCAMAIITTIPPFRRRPATFTDPVINLGPDGDSYRDPADGQIKDGSEEGVPVGSLTAHRSPLGLVFDVEGALGAELTATALWSAGPKAIPTATVSMAPLATPARIYCIWTWKKRRTEAITKRG